MSTPMADRDAESQTLDAASEDEKPVQSPEEFPEGGPDAVKTVIGAFFGLFVQFGIMNSFGAFENRYATVELSNKTPSEIAWIGTFQLFFFFFSGAFIGRLFDSFGPTVLIAPGSVLLVFGLMMTSLCKQYYQFFLAQGLVFGAGSAMIFYPALSSITHWYNKKRGAMMGLTTAGSSLGGVVFPIALNKLIPRVGFPWAVRIVAFICLAFLIPAIFLVRTRLPRRPFNNLSNLLDFDGLRDIRYVLFMIGGVITMLGTFNPYYYVESFAAVHGFDSNVTLYILSIQNAGSFFGRILPGIIGDKLGYVNVLAIACTSAGVVMFFWLLVTTAPGLLGWAVFYGFSSGAYIALLPACIGKFTPDTTKYGGRAGLMFGFVGIAALAGPPIAGALLNQDHGSYRHLIIFSGVVCIAGATFFWAARLASNPKLFAKF